MADIPRIDPKQTRDKMKAEEGALTLQEFEGHVPSLPKDREIVFCCA